MICGNESVQLELDWYTNWLGIVVLLKIAFYGIESFE